MPKVILSPRAKKDFGKILARTQKDWGVNQRIKYHDQLESRIFYLAEKPGKGRRSDKIKKPLLFYPEGRHVIFYRKISDGIEIVRILHDRMDFNRHL